MATTSARTLKLLSIFATGVTQTAAGLAERLGVSARTVRRDIDTLRELGYAIEPVYGPEGGYRLGRGTRLPPVVFDEEQAVAAAVALQTAPAVLAGIQESAGRALATLRQVMPERTRLEADAFTVTQARNYWEFPAPPIDAAVVRDIGAAIRQGHELRAEYAGAPATTVEPHHLVVWAGRWYLLAYDLHARRWRAMRVDRITTGTPTLRPFARRPLPGDVDPATFVMNTPDRGDTLAEWPCRGSAVLAYPASTVSRFAPGGSTVEHLSDRACRLSLGAWSWAGLAGLLLTFDSNLTDVEPAELRAALVTVYRRLATLAGPAGVDGPADPA